MIRKTINKDGTFGANFDFSLFPYYKKHGILPVVNYVDVPRELACEIDKNSDMYKYEDKKVICLAENGGE